MQQPISQSTIDNYQSKIHWPSVWQLGLSLLGTLTLWSFSLALGLMGVSSIFNASISGIGSDPMPLILVAAGAASGGILLLPSAGYALLHILNRPSPVRFKLRYPSLLIFLIPPVVGLGYLATRNANLAWIALPPLHVIAIGVSILWLLSLGLRGLSVGSAQRAWGIFGCGMVLAPTLSLVVELGVLLVVTIFGVSYLARDPILASKLIQLSEGLVTSPNQPPKAIFELLEPYLLQPGTIYIGLIFGAVIVPLIEELFKPIGVWLLVGRKPTAVQGFAAGLLSGAGFALFENFTLSASSGEEWSIIVLARIGTSMIHILTAGLTGWALALAWRKGRYWRLGVTYLVSVSIHALWNGTVILAILLALVPTGFALPSTLFNVGMAAPFLFIVLLVGSFALLLGCNAALRRAIIPPALTQPEAATTNITPAANSIEEENPTHGNHQLSD